MSQRNSGNADLRQGDSSLDSESGCGTGWLPTLNVTSLSKDTSLTEVSRRCDQQFFREVTNRQTDEAEQRSRVSQTFVKVYIYLSSTGYWRHRL